MPEAGWLARQLDKVREESEKLPSWMQYSQKPAKQLPTSKPKPPAKATGFQAKKRG